MIVRRYEVLVSYPGSDSLRFFRVNSVGKHRSQEAQRNREPLQASRYSASVQAPQEQPQIHSGNVDQQPFENIVVFSQMGSSHAAGFVTVREGPLDQFATLPQQPLTFRPLQPTPVRVHQL